MSTRELLLEETNHQPESMLRECLHYLNLLACRREAEMRLDVLPTHAAGQDVLDIPGRP